MRLSLRNQLQGTVREVTPDAVTTTVNVELAGGDLVTSSITKQAADELALEPDQQVTVIMKSSDVILGVN